MLKDHRTPGALRSLTVNNRRDHFATQGMVIKHATINIK